MRILISVVGILVASCIQRSQEQSRFETPPKPNDSGMLRLAGYYYDVDRIGTTTVFFLYSNGIVLVPGAFPKERVPSIEDVIGSPETEKKLKEVELAWGKYEIEGDSIIFEQLQSNGTYFVVRRSGIILNDSTFQLLFIDGPHIEGRKKYEQRFHFKPFKPKPDSTNQFIK